MDSFSEVSLPLAVPLAPPNEEPNEDSGTWIWIENDSEINNTNNQNSTEDLFNNKENNNFNNSPVVNQSKFSWIKNKMSKIIPGNSNKIDKLFDVAEKSYKFVEKKPELAIVAVGLGVGVMYVATKLILNGGFIYYCLKPNITFNTTNNVNKK